MLKDTVFSLAKASVLQDLAFLLFAAFTIGFFIWVAYLVMKK
jgi:hypothetical protein